jgi:predicted amidohydrolase
MALIAGNEPRMKKWRATCIQMSSDLAALAPDRQGAWQIIEGNVARAVRLIDRACAETASKPHLVVLPEFAMQGPPHGASIAQWIENACATIPGPVTGPLQELAKRQAIFIAGNQFEIDPKWPGRFFNTCFLIDPQGEIILRFRRINTAVWPSPHDFMDDYLAEEGFEGAFPVVDTELGRFAMMACGEIAIPEVARVFMMRGAEIILHPTNEEHSAAQEAAKVARAAENMVYVVSANVARGIGFSRDGSIQGGRSHILDFRGHTLAFELGAGESFGVSAAIDIDALRAARADLGMANTLARARWDMYRPFYAAAVGYPSNSFRETPMVSADATIPLVQESIGALRRAGVLCP